MSKLNTFFLMCQCDPGKKNANKKQNKNKCDSDENIAFNLWIFLTVHTFHRFGWGKPSCDVSLMVTITYILYILIVFVCSPCNRKFRARNLSWRH